MSDNEENVVIIGAGQAGLSMSSSLTMRGIAHVVLERDHIAEAWRSRRWDSLRLITPNWTVLLPNFHYDGPDPDGFMPKSEVLAYLQRYASTSRVPIMEHSGVQRLSVIDRPPYRFELVTDQGDRLRARHVVVATGPHQRPRIPAFAGQLDASICQIPSMEYRNPAALPSGGVLVVGSGNSGAPIAAELHRSGRKVVLAVGGSGRTPRLYRGKDAFWWFVQTGRIHRTVDEFASPADARNSLRGGAGGLIVSGNSTAPDCGPLALQREGIILAGHVTDGAGSTITFADDLEASLVRSHRFLASFQQEADELARAQKLDLASDNWADVARTPPAHGPTRLNLREESISTIIWANGYQVAFDWVDIPVLGQGGYPLQRRGTTSQPGLYFLGLAWMHTWGSAFFYGVGSDAEHLAETIVSQA